MSSATQWLDRGGRKIAYETRGEGPLVVCVPGIGDLRQEYRYLEPALADAGFRVAALDLRGHGESSTGFDDLTPAAIGADVLALVRHLGADRAVVVGTSMAAGAAVWAAAEEPDAIAGLVLIGPFVRDVGSRVKDAVLRTLLRVLLLRPWGVGFWMKYWASLFPSKRPPDFDAYAEELRKNLSDPARLAALRAMMLGPSRRDIEQRMDRVRAPALVMMGTKDRDFDDPVAEADLVARRLHGDVALVDGAGHYPHVESPEDAVPAIVDFARAAAA